MDDQNLILDVLRYAVQRDEFTFFELCDAVNPTPTQKEQLRLMIGQGGILVSSHHNFHWESRKEGGKAEKTLKLFASAEDHFRLLEHTELQEARASSITANRFATAALILTFISTVASIFVSFF